VNKNKIIVGVLLIFLYKTSSAFQFGLGTKEVVNKIISQGQKEGKIASTKEEKLNQSQTVPLPPSNLYAIAISSYQINLSWQDNSVNETGFKIERKKKYEEMFVQIAVLPANVTFYIDTGLEANTTYYYHVKSYNSVGDSVYSNETYAVTTASTQGQFNTQPNIISLTSSLTNVPPLSTTTITCIATDPDGDILTYSWIYSSGTISGSGNSVIWQSPVIPGTFTITCIVSDGKSGSVQKSVDVYVNYDIKILWQKSFSKESLAIDSYGITIDTSGNIYVSGYTTSTITNRDIVIYKFSSDGNILWNKNYDSSGPLDIGMGITSDKYGNVYVTGQVFNSSNFTWDIVTLKYNPSGNLLWQKKYDGGSSEGGFGIVVEPEDNSVYVAGTSSRGINSDDIIVIKYDNNGNTVWVSTYNAGIKDHAYSIALDKENNIYVCGYVLKNTYDYIVIKYDRNGNKLWERIYDSGEHDNAIGIVCDSENNVYVAGQSYNGTNYDFLVIKYNTNGNLVWVKRYDTGKDDLGYAVAVDKYDNIYITGQSGNQTNLTSFDFLTIKYDKHGNFV
jgi:uncharacterized delta-60 repeat protein